MVFFFIILVYAKVAHGEFISEKSAALIYNSGGIRHLIRILTLEISEAGAVRFALIALFYLSANSCVHCRRSMILFPISPFLGG